MAWVWMDGLGVDGCGWVAWVWMGGLGVDGCDWVWMGVDGGPGCGWGAWVWMGGLGVDAPVKSGGETVERDGQGFGTHRRGDQIDLIKRLALSDE